MNRAHILLLTRFALLEVLRRKDGAVLGLFTAVSLVFLTIARIVGFETPSAATFLLNLSLSLLTGLAHLVTLLVATRQIPEELERRTLFPLLARPVTRPDVLLGKTLAAWITGLCTYLCLLIPVMLLVPRLAPHDPGTFWQMALLALSGLALTASLGLFLSLFLPKSLAIAAGALLLFGAGSMARWRWIGSLLHLLPSPVKSNLTLRYTDGAPPMSAEDVSLLLLYTVLWMLLLLAVSARGFTRRALS